jgi:hypothetical protein
MLEARKESGQIKRIKGTRMPFRSSMSIDPNNWTKKITAKKYMGSDNRARINTVKDRIDPTSSTNEPIRPFRGPKKPLP